jgi:hypothetical protein
MAIFALLSTPLHCTPPARHVLGMGITLLRPANTMPLPYTSAIKYTYF